MITMPIIPIWLMTIISLALLMLIIIKAHYQKWLDILIVILLFLVNLRIMYPNGESVVVTNNLDVLLVVDDTISMNAEDYAENQTRLSGAKKDCVYIIQELNGARFSIIYFNNSSKIAIPYTRDANLAISAVEALTPIDELYAKGSSLNTPLPDILASLKSSTKKEGHIRALFFVSDGEITNEEPLQSFQAVKSYISDGAVLGYGTATGGYMRDTSKYSNGDYISDYSSSSYDYRAISKIDENNLRQLANDMGIEYIKMDDESQVHHKVQQIKNLATSNLEDSTKQSYGDLYFIFVILLFVLLLLKVIFSKGVLL